MLSTDDSLSLPHWGIKVQFVGRQLKLPVLRDGIRVLEEVLFQTGTLADPDGIDYTVSAPLKISNILIFM